MFAAALAIVAGISGCEKKTSDRNLVLIDPTETQRLLEGHRRLLGLAGADTAVLVDPRNTSQYDEGHIPGAISIPFQRVTAEQYRLRGYDVIIVYGADYNDEKAIGMSKRLMELGFKDVRTLRGGMRAWESDGNELESATGNEE